MDSVILHLLEDVAGSTVALATIVAEHLEGHSDPEEGAVEEARAELDKLAEVFGKVMRIRNVSYNGESEGWAILDNETEA